MLKQGYTFAEHAFLIDPQMFQLSGDTEDASKLLNSECCRYTLGDLERNTRPKKQDSSADANSHLASERNGDADDEDIEEEEDARFSSDLKRKVEQLESDMANVSGVLIQAIKPFTSITLHYTDIISMGLAMHSIKFTVLNHKISAAGKSICSKATLLGRNEQFK